MKLVSIVGARPQFIKAAAVSRELRRRHHEVLVHTGQHYDYEMSGIFFEGLEIPRPDVNLGVGSGSHGAQTATVLKGVEAVLLDERPDYLLIYGDTKGVYGGASLQTGGLFPDSGDNQEYYGKKLTMSEILVGGKVEPTEAAKLLGNKIEEYGKPATK